MKLLSILSVVGVCLPILVSAQNATPLVPTNPSTSTYIHCSEFYVSKPMRDLPDYKPTVGENHEAADKKRRNIHPNNNIPNSSRYDYSDPIRQTEVGKNVGSAAPIVDFDGAAESASDPGDPNGAVNSSYYVQAINVTYTVFNKTGGTVMATKNLGSLWSGNPQDGDPVVLYDKFADRWVISEFQVTTTPYQFCVAVSKTNDPTGAFYVWKFSMGGIFPDYPKYAIWNNGYYVTFQAFNGGNPRSPQEVAVLERNRMIEGSPSAGMILANTPATPSLMGDNNSLFTAGKVLDCDASALPPYGTPDYLVFFQCRAAGGYSNSIIMDSLVVDTTLHTFRIARADSFAVTTFNDYFSGGNLTDISQPGALHAVDALDGTFNFRVPYMINTGYNSVVLSNTVNLGHMVAGIRWYELRQVAGIWSIYQSGTFGPNDGASRWNASICQDYYGNIGLEYSIADSVSLYPSIRYTGRLSTDPIGQMTFAEQTAIAGTGSLSNTFGRWGDYSQLDIDPSDGLTFWGINQYGSAASNSTQMNRIFSFKLAPVGTGINGIYDETSVKAYQNGSFLEVKASGLPSNDQLIVDLFDIEGRHLATQNIMPSNNMFETQINVSTLPKGVYFVRIGKVNFQHVIKIEIN